MPSFFRNSPEVSSPACELPSRTTASSPGSISSASKEINPLNPKGLKPYVSLLDETLKILIKARQSLIDTMKPTP
nr:hypothetical protein L203_03502 [Cryptococcus depauperatus CBS 7841]ODN98638.1 hypothetical protein L204_02602 [Cryptococcus depauperatus CBS 7855]